MTKDKYRVFSTVMSFVMSVALVLGALSDNLSPFTGSVFSGLTAGTLVILLVAGLHKNRAVRNQRVLKTLSILAVIWTISGILFFQASRSRIITSIFIITYTVILAVVIFLDKD